MKLFDKSTFEYILKSYRPYQEMIESLSKDVQEFFDNFNDSPTKRSAWGHNYFCPKDGGLLQFDLNKPKDHTCSVCGHVYHDELFNEVWNYMYRNEAAVNCIKTSLLYQVTGNPRYLDYLKKTVQFYTNHYLEFPLHNKEGLYFDSLQSMKWGAGRIMPQGLNECIFIIRLVLALELSKDEFIQTEIEAIHNNLFTNVYELLKPQIHKIHNIACWYDCAIGVMGLFSGDSRMLSTAFEGDLNVRQQVQKGVTEDGFWYEGSIHYNFFTLEGLSNLLLFCKLYEYDFGPEEKTLEKMFKAAYYLAFNNQQFPNPNDGWPNINLKTYSQIYAIGAKIFGLNSEVGQILANIVHDNYERGTVPLSKPYFYKNSISLEQLILVPEIINKQPTKMEHRSTDYKASNFAMLRNDKINVFLKYGHNGPSHAHPDKMNIEVVINNKSLSRDLSNSGYGNTLCNEWHRLSLSHNTVVIGGQSHTSTDRGETIEFKPDLVVAKAKDVYPGVDFQRKVQISEKSFTDEFKVESNNSQIKDYIFHVEADLITQLQGEKTDLSFDKNGYQHLSDVVKLEPDSSHKICLNWNLAGTELQQTIDAEEKEVYLCKSLDNPVDRYRWSVIVRTKVENPVFSMKWEIK